MPRNLRLARRITILACIYAVLLAGAIRLHWLTGLPEQSSPGLLVAFAVLAAVVGLVSTWAALAVTHWSMRASGYIVGVAFAAGLLTLFYEWNSFLVWQLLVIIYSQAAVLILVLGVLRIFGFTIRSARSAFEPDAAVSERATQFSVQNLLFLMTALALLFCVLHYAQPVSFGGAVASVIYKILIMGGVGAAIVALGALWACFADWRLAIRAVIAVLVAPTGGIVYRIAETYGIFIEFSAPWYAGVTTLQLILMIVPFATFRAAGYRITRAPLSPAVQ